MTETKKYICNTRILGSELYLEGEVIELDAKSAKRLLAEKKIAPFKDIASKGNADDGGQKGEGEKGGSPDAGKESGSEGKGSGKDSKDESLKDKPKGKGGNKK